MKPEIDLLLAACAIAVFTDVRKRKIPNWLTAGLAAGALALHVPQGWVAVGTSLAACVVVFALGTIAHRVGVFGGGDVKLLAAGSLAVGYPDCLPFVLYTFLGGGVLAVAFALAQRRLRSTLANVRALAQTHTLLDDAAPSARMPYAIAIASGAAILALADTILPAMRFPT
jgi:prepilin peptidase CpaA